MAIVRFSNGVRQYFCTKCDQFKAETEFYIGSKSRCKTCASAIAGEYAKKKREEKLVSMKQIERKPQQKIQKVPRVNKRDEQFGSVYFIQSRDGLSSIKIGHTSGSVQRRLNSIEGQSPLPLKVIASFPGTLQDEQRLHKRFAYCRHHHEWFHPDKKLLNLIAYLSEQEGQVELAA